MLVVSGASMKSTRSTSRRFTWLACAFAILSVSSLCPAFAQVIMGGEEEAPPEVGFALPKEDSKTVDKIDDFDRYVGKKSWELAFTSINTILQADPKGMVPVG